MKGKQLVILAAVAVILTIVAIKSSKQTPHASLDLIGKTILADVDINEVDVLSIVGASDSATIERNDTGWVVKERFGYPANFEKVRDAIIALTEVKVSDVVDLDPSEFKRLNIADPSDANDSKKVSLNGAGKVLGEMTLGKEHMSENAGPAGMGGYPDGRYVADAERENVFRVSEPFSAISDKPIDWVDTELLNVNGADLVTVSITGPQGQTVSLVSKDGDLALTDLAETEELDTSKSASIKNALSYLTMRDIAMPELSDEAMGFDKATTFEAFTRSATTYTLHVGGKAESDGQYLRIAVTYSASEEATAQDGESEDAAAQRKEAAEKAKLDAETLNAKLANWTYVIASYKGDALLTPRASLVKPKVIEAAPAVERTDSPEPPTVEDTTSE